MMSTWTVTKDKILALSEVQAVVADLKRKGRRSVNTRMNLVIFRLATGAGLRASELTRLTLDNVRVGSDKPTIRVPKIVGKGHKARVIPLTFDQGTLDDIRAWKEHRIQLGAAGNDLFICSRNGTQIDRRNARKRFKAACRVLGRERQAEVTIHHGRHTFISHALHNRFNPVAVRDAAGHSSLAITSIYAHLIDDADGKVGNMYDKPKIATSVKPANV
jgi:integrase/recombinase XerD